MTGHDDPHIELQTLYALGTISRRRFMAGLAALGVPGVSKSVLEQQVSGRYAVLIVIDGARPSYLSLTSLPHFAALMEQGVVYEQAWVGAVESTTPAVHATLGTGTLPRQNGFLGFGWVQPTTRGKVDFRTLLAEGKIDPVLRALPLPSVATRLQQTQRGATAVAASGHKDYAVVGLGGGAAKYELYGRFAENEFTPAYMHSAPPLTPSERRSLTIKSPIPIGGEDAWAFQYALDVVRHVKPRLLMLNLPEVDTWGHWYGPSDSLLFERLLLNLDRGLAAIQALYRELGILDQTNFIITADHAMLESRPVHGWTDTVKSAVLAARTEVARADGTTGAIWLVDAGKAKAVAQQLVASRPSHVHAVYYRSGLGSGYNYVPASPPGWLATEDVGVVLQNLLDTTAGKHGPDVWVIFEEYFTASPRNVTGEWKGTHGGATWEAQHIPLILSGPDVRKGVRSQFPARSIDVAPTLESLLGLPPLGRPGVVLADAQVSPSSDALSLQAQIEPQLRRDVHALQTQSLVDKLRLIQQPRRTPIPPWPHDPPTVITPDMPTCD